MIAHRGHTHDWANDDVVDVVDVDGWAARGRGT